VQLAQHVCGHLSHGIIVIDKENAGLQIGADRLLLPWISVGFMSKLGAWQKDTDRRAIVFGRIDAYSAVRLLGKALHLTQT
jgi:hypothetical protein